MDALRDITNEQRVAVETALKMESTKRIEFLRVEWHGCVHSNEFQLTRDIEKERTCYLRKIRTKNNFVPISFISNTCRILYIVHSQVTLGTAKKLRDIANEIIIDIVVYLTPDFRERIISNVVLQLNSIYR